MELDATRIYKATTLTLASGMPDRLQGFSIVRPPLHMVTLLDG